MRIGKLYFSSFYESVVHGASELLGTFFQFLCSCLTQIEYDTYIWNSKPYAIYIFILLLDVSSGDKVKFFELFRMFNQIWEILLRLMYQKY